MKIEKTIRLKVAGDGKTIDDKQLAKINKLALVSLKT